MSRSNLVTISIPSFIYDLNIFMAPSKEKEAGFSVAEYVREMRDENWRRYDDKIGEAMTALFQKPKQEWPKLLKNPA